MEFWIFIALFLSIVDLVLICKTFKVFTEITDNQNELIQVLNDDIQRLRDDGK